MTRLFFLLCLSAFLSSCTLGFNREWRAALRKGPQPGLEGAWEGTWHSEASGHRGRLRSVVGPAKNKEGDHAFHYHATWAGILSGAYRADHRVTPDRGQGNFQFQGQHQMPGWAGGLYTYRGTVKGDEFHATYECTLDEGSFQMKRVKK